MILWIFAKTTHDASVTHFVGMGIGAGDLLNGHLFVC